MNTRTAAKDTGKPQFIAAPQDLRRKAVNYRTGTDINLTPEMVQKIERVIAAKGDAFAIEILDKLRAMRRTIADAGSDMIARTVVRPGVAALALEIKGMGGMFGYPLLTKLAKSLNDFSLSLDTPNPKQFEVMRLHVDAMYVILAQHVTGEGSTSEQDLVVLLGSAIAKVTQKPRRANGK